MMILMILATIFINIWCAFVMLVLMIDGAFGHLLEAQREREKLKEKHERRKRLKLIKSEDDDQAEN